MKIVASDDLFALVYDNSRRGREDAIIAKEKCGFKFDPITGMLTGNASSVDLLKNHKLLLNEKLTITDRAAQLYTEAGRKILSAVEQSHAKESDMIIPCPEGLEYLPFQRAGIAYAAQRHMCLVADEMGLGKTVQAIGAINASEAHRILIVCPASLKHNWRREFKKWDTKNLSVEIIDGEEEYVFSADVVIINYDILAAHRAQIKSTAWDVVILDECHYLKSGKSDRTLEVFGGIERNSDKTIKERFEPIPARRMLLLSGTPLVNKPKELWPLLRAIDPEGLGADWMHYARRYCEARPLERMNTQTMKMERFGWVWDGAANLEELQEIMRSRFMVRPAKKDVLTDLPAKRRQVIILEPKPQLAKLIAKEIKEYEAMVPGGYDGENMPSIGEIVEIRKKIALKKVSYAVEYIREVLNETQKVVVFAHHHEVIDALEEAFSGCCVRLDGRVDSEARQSAVDTFQNDEKCRIFIGGIQAAGIGLTLTVASHVLFVELSWVPGEITQAEDRCHRIGQKESVLVQHLILEGSLDERVIEVIIKKQEILDKVLDTPTTV